MDIDVIVIKKRYMEEAKFQLQEEQELLMYHPYDRRMYTGGPCPVELLGVS